MCVCVCDWLPFTKPGSGLPEDPGGEDLTNDDLKQLNGIQPNRSFG